MSQKVTLAVSQSRTLSTLQQTLDSLAKTTQLAASKNVDLILFPEAFLGGYPRTCAFGATIGSRTDSGREQYLQYFKSCVDLGDTPLGAGDGWIERKLPVAKGEKYRGDGTREYLEKVARETGVFVVTGLVEKSGGTLYCAVVYVDPQRGVIGKRRKVMPTGSERLVWGQGSPSTLKAVTTRIRGVKITMAAAICWENMMPLLRYSIYSQNVNLWLAPTADARDTWLPLMRTVGNEGRCFVLSAISCQKKSSLPGWVTGTSTNSAEPVPVNGSLSPARGRRRSTFTTPDQRHELVLPTTDEDADSASVPAPVSAMKTDSAAVNGTHSASNDEFACRGGSCIVGPMGQVLKEPLWEVEDGGLLIQEVDFEDCERGRLDLDVAGSYSRNDAFHLTVDGLDLNPPP
ncbi:Nitrilase 3 [Pseudocercospora fuligena]|uniref:Nitrilase 3 n=1 Tax=Pseudocercospora fuligena TaxID=685502 RepID=A0A8H6RU97_9PEZI|nr:Nitrilase 3 [Pseudocercospora fuligena]